MPPNRNWSRRIEACFKKVFVDVYDMKRLSKRDLKIFINFYKDSAKDF